MKESAIKKIAPVKGYGITGYSVEFSIKDLYRLRYLAARVFDTCQADTAECKLAELISDLFATTVGDEDDRSWDFLSDREGAE